MEKCVLRLSPLHGVGLFVRRESIAAGAKVFTEIPLLERIAAEPTTPERTAAHDKMFADIRNLSGADLNTLLRFVKKDNLTHRDLTLENLTSQLQDPPETLSAAILNTFFGPCFPFGANDNPTVHRLFQRTRLLNHSCQPNAEVWWDDKAKRMVLQATQRIDVNMEIVISYIDQFKAQSGRHSDLGFVCQCPQCGLTGLNKDLFEASMAVIGLTLKNIDAFRSQYFPTSPHGVQALDTTLMRAMVQDPYREVVLNVAMDIIPVFNSLEIYHSRLANACEMIYILSASTAAVNPQARFHDATAFEYKLQELEKLVQCLGIEHPRAMRAMDLLVILANHNMMRMDKVADLVRRLGLKVEYREKDLHIWTKS